MGENSAAIFKQDWYVWGMETYFVLLVVFYVIGVLDTLYLVYHMVRGTDVACPFFPDEWCRTVQHSRQSKTFGIPNSVAGLCMYSLLLLLLGLHAYVGTSFWPITLIVTIGFLFSTYFMYVQAFVLRAFCTWCVVSFVNFLVMAIAVYFLR